MKGYVPNELVEKDTIIHSALSPTIYLIIDGKVDGIDKGSSRKYQHDYYRKDKGYEITDNILYSYQVRFLTCWFFNGIKLPENDNERCVLIK
jgi:hypothetical protein